MRSGATGTPSSASCIDQLQIAIRARRIITARGRRFVGFFVPLFVLVFCGQKGMSSSMSSNVGFFFAAAL